MTLALMKSALPCLYPLRNSALFDEERGYAANIERLKSVSTSFRSVRCVSPGDRSIRGKPQRAA